MDIETSLSAVNFQFLEKMERGTYIKGLISGKLSSFICLPVPTGPGPGALIARCEYIMTLTAHKIWTTRAHR